MLVDKIEFSVLNPEIIKNMTVARITKTELYDQEGYPIEGGLMDPRLGVVDPGVRCRTCGCGRDLICGCGGAGRLLRLLCLHFDLCWLVTLATLLLAPCLSRLFFDPVLLCRTVFFTTIAVI